MRQMTPVSSVGSQSGQDAAVIDVADQYLVVTSDPITRLEC